MELLKLPFAARTAPWLQFEGNTGVMMLFDSVEIWRRLGKRQFHQTPMSLLATPMIFAERGEHCVPQRKLSFGQIAPNEISLFRELLRPSQFFPDEQ